MDDEINFVELWNAMVRKRLIVMLVTLISTSLAGIYAYYKPTQYRYNTAIEVGSYPIKTENGIDRRLVEPRDSVELKLRLAYIPLARSEINNEGTAPQVTIGTHAGKTSGGRLFVLTSQGPETAKNKIEILHDKVLDILVKDHAKALQNLIEQQRSKIRAEQARLDYESEFAVQQASLKALTKKLQTAKQNYAALDQDHAIKLASVDASLQRIKAEKLNSSAHRDQIKASIKRLDQREQLIQEQISAIQQRIDHLQGDRDLAVTESSKNSNAVAVLMLGSEMAQTERRLWELRNSYSVDLKAEREALNRQLIENANNAKQFEAELAELNEQRKGLVSRLSGDKMIAAAEIERLETEINKGKQVSLLKVNQLREAVQNLKSELADMVPTKALYVAVRSVEPEPPGKTILITIGLLFGLMLGTFVALLSELADSRKR